MKHSLTVKKLEALKPKESRYRVADGGGLEVSVETSGRKIFRARVMVDGKRKEITYGPYPALSLAEAREMHEKEIAKIKRACLPTSQTFIDLFEQWLTHYASQPSPRTKHVPTALTVRKQRMRIQLHLSEIHDIPVAKLKRGQLIEIFDGITAREEARQTFNTLKVFFEWCTIRQYIEYSPLAEVRSQSIGLSQPKRRHRVLTLDEMAWLYNAVSSMRGIAVRVILLTGARRAMVAGMTWSEVGDEWWHIPAERMKSREEQFIFNNFADVIAPLRGKGREFVFSSKSKSGHLRGDSITTYLDRLYAETSAKNPNIRKFHAHALRRSVRTAWAEHLKALPHVGEMMLAHKKEKLEGVYNKALQLDDQKVVWEAWRTLLLTRAAELSREAEQQQPQCPP